MGTASTDLETDFLRSATDALTEPFSSLTAAAVFGKSVLKDNEGGSHGFGASSFLTRLVRSWLVKLGVRPLGRDGLAVWVLEVAVRALDPLDSALNPAFCPGRRWLGRGVGAIPLATKGTNRKRSLLMSLLNRSGTQGPSN